MTKDKKTTRKKTKSARFNSQKLSWKNEENYMKDRLEAARLEVKDRPGSYVAFEPLKNTVTETHKSDPEWCDQWHPAVQKTDDLIKPLHKENRDFNEVLNDTYAILAKVLNDTNTNLLTPEQKAEVALLDMEDKIALATKEYLTAKRKLMILKAAWNDAHKGLTVAD